MIKTRNPKGPVLSFQDRLQLFIAGAHHQVSHLPERVEHCSSQLSMPRMRGILINRGRRS